MLRGLLVFGQPKGPLGLAPLCLRLARQVVYLEPSALASGFVPKPLKKRPEASDYGSIKE